MVGFGGGGGTGEFWKFVGVTCRLEREGDGTLPKRIEPFELLDTLCADESDDTDTILKPSLSITESNSRNSSMGSDGSGSSRSVSSDWFCNPFSTLLRTFLLRDIDGCGLSLVLSPLRPENSALAGSMLVRGLPLPLFCVDDDATSLCFTGDSALGWAAATFRLFDVDLPVLERSRGFLGIPPFFVLVGEASFPAFSGTIVVKVRSAKTLDGEHWGTVPLSHSLSGSACTVIRIRHGLASFSPILLGEPPLIFCKVGVVMDISWA